MSVCMSVCLCLSVSVCMSLCLSVCLHVCMCVCLVWTIGANAALLQKCSVKTQWASQPSQPFQSTNFSLYVLLNSKSESVAITKKSDCYCCCDSPASLLLSSVIHVEEARDRSRVVPQVCKLCRMALTVEQMLYGVWCDRHLICCWWCGPCNCSKADSDQNATGQEWYGLIEAADFQVVRYRVVKLQGLCLVQN